MGSWNETCLLSGLPIRYGEEVVMLLLVKNPYSNFGGPVCNINDLFFVRSIPLFGVYDDYGKIKLLEGEDETFDLIKEQFASDLFEHEQSERDKLLSIPSVKNSNFNLENFLNWLHEGHVQIDKNFATKNSFGHKPKLIHVAKVLIRKNVWDSLLEMKLEGWQGTEKIEDYRKDAYQYIDSLEKTIVSKQKEIKELCQVSDDVPGSGYLSSTLENFAYELYSFDKHNIFTTKFGFSHVGSDPYCGVDNRNIMSMLRDKFIKGIISKENFTKFCLRYSELFMIEAVMATTRQCWHISAGTGSQATNWSETIELHLRMAKCGVENGIDDLEEYYKIEDITEKEISALSKWEQTELHRLKKMKTLKEKLDILMIELYSC